MVYKIEFYAYLPKILIYFFLHFDSKSDPDPDPWKKCWILIPDYLTIWTYDIEKQQQRSRSEFPPAQKKPRHGTRGRSSRTTRCPGFLPVEYIVAFLLSIFISKIYLLNWTGSVFFYSMNLDPHCTKELDWGR